jgi:hypothetical protein
LHRFVIILIISILLNPGFIPAQNKHNEDKTHSIPRIEAEVHIDGRLDEPVWEREAAQFSMDIEVMPAENIPAPAKGECFLMYDKNHLYAAFRAYDPHPDQIRAHLSDRDEMWNNDLVGVLLDTFNDENRGFAFFANPLGVQGDEIFSKGGSREDQSWDAIWASAGNITDFGYVVEMAIPFRAMQFQPSEEEQIWGFAPIRNYPRSHRHQISSFPIDRDQMNCLLCQLPKIKGFAGAEPGRNIELDPTITGLHSDQRTPFPSGSLEKDKAQADVGISGRWGFTNNLTLSGAINPDFSQVEADAAQMEINKQFALYYPEKRPFFLEGQDFFETPFRALYTRSVADPEWGIKVSGKEGPHALGIFSAQDSITNLIFPGPEGSRRDFLSQSSFANVLRYRRDIGNSSTLGLLITDREGQSYHNRLGGVDGLLRLNKSDTLSFQLLGSQTAYPQDTADAFDQDPEGLSGYAGQLEFNRQTRSYLVFGKYADIHPEFRADLGFMPQVGYRRFELGGGYLYFGDEDSFFSQIQVVANYDQSNDYDHNLLEKELESVLSMQGPLMSRLNFVIGGREKVFRQERFSQFFNHIMLSFRPTGSFYASISVSYGDEIDYSHVRAGKYVQFNPGITMNLGKHFNLSGNYMNYRLHIGGERLFMVHLPQIKFIYHFNRRAFFRAILQYRKTSRNPDLYLFEIDPDTETLFSQLLFSYKLNPRTVLFLGYNDNYLGFDGVELTQKDRTFFLKIGYAWTF